MKVEVLRKLGHNWVVILYKNGNIIDWRPATAAEILATLYA